MTTIIATTATTSTTSLPPPVLVEHGPRDKKQIALTFDGDMTPAMRRRVDTGTMRSPQYDPGLFDLLRRTHAAATFFVTGMWSEMYTDELRQLAADPSFEIENHSYDHSAWKSPCFGLPIVTDPAAQLDEITKTDTIVRGITGRPTRYFRFPGGCNDAAGLQLVASTGHVAVGWDDESGDAFAHDASAVARQTIAHAQPGAIIVAHLNGAPNAPVTAGALSTAIPELQKQGYTFVRLDTLLG